MDSDLQSLQKGAIHREGRRRLRILLGVVGSGACATAMLLILVFYGVPYNPMWWGAMAVILAASAVAAALCAPIIEWVIAGYLGGSVKR